MDLYLKINMIIHVTLGFLALITGLIPMIVVKGNKIHRTTGLIYFYSMVGIVITSLIISIHKEILFFIALSTFAFYLVFTGFRYARNHLYSPGITDWIIAVISLSVAIYMISTLEILFLVFGAIFFLQVFIDLKRFIKKDKPNKKLWLGNHIGRMIGGYIATTTAFLVNNINIDNMLVVWLTPTIIGTAFIIYSIRKYTESSVPKKIILKNPDDLN